MFQSFVRTLIFIILPVLFLIFILIPLTPFVLIASTIRAIKEKDFRVFVDDVNMWFSEPDTYLSKYIDD